jgi:hypothetical protein
MISKSYTPNNSISSVMVVTHEHWLKLILQLLFVCFVVRGESPDCRLLGTTSMFQWLRNFLPHHSLSHTERWSSNTLRVVTARMFYVLSGFLRSPFILNNSVETAAMFAWEINTRIPICTQNYPILVTLDFTGLNIPKGNSFPYLKHDYLLLVSLQKMALLGCFYTFQRTVSLHHCSMHKCEHVKFHHPG